MTFVPTHSNPSEFFYAHIALGSAFLSAVVRPLGIRPAIVPFRGRPCTFHALRTECGAAAQAAGIRRYILQSVAFLYAPGERRGRIVKRERPRSWHSAIRRRAVKVGVGNFGPKQDVLSSWP
jgi:hypothetical protein